MGLWYLKKHLKFGGLHSRNLFLDEAIRVVFNRIGAGHLRSVFGRGKKKKPVWITHEIWKEMLHIWVTNERYLHRAATNKRNRGVALERGTPGYHGGSVNITVHRRKRSFEKNHQ